MNNYTDTSQWTYGAELELADLDQRRGLPSDKYAWDRKDVTMVNSNGIAVDPKGVSYPFGGEIQTPPTLSIDGQTEMFERVFHLHRNATVNYRCNLHIHIRVPGLADSLEALKRVQRYVKSMPGWLDVLEPIPPPLAKDYPDKKHFDGARRRYNRRKVSHHTVVSDSCFDKQMRSSSVAEFFACEAPADRSGAPLFHLAPRSAVNLRQLMQTDTIEFRHFPGTTSSLHFRNSLLWCFEFLNAALNTGESLQALLVRVQPQLPLFRPYVHWMEERYLLTAHNGSLPRSQIEANIKKILSV